MIFPAVFSFGIAPSAGAQLVFITLPNVFEQLPFSSLWSLIFYILLAMAALTSTISLHEVVTAYIHEEFHMTRKKAAWLVSVGVFIFSIYVFFMKYVSPIAIGIVFLNELGLLSQLKKLF